MATLSTAAQAEIQSAIDLLVKGTAYQTPFSEDVAARAARAAENSGFLTQGGFLAAVKGRPISTLLQWLQFFGGLSSADQARLRDALVQLNGTTYELSLIH